MTRQGFRAFFAAAAAQLELPGFGSAEPAAATESTGGRDGPPGADGVRSSLDADLTGPSDRIGRARRPLTIHPPASPAHPDAVVFRHPQAGREIQLGHALVAYEFRRVKRRSIGMVVTADGLSVRAPRWVGVGEIESALREKAAWIRAKLVEQHERARRQAASRMEWRDGSHLPFLGETVILVLDPRTTGAVLDAAEGLAQGQIDGVARRTLHVGLPHTAEPAQIRDVVQAWLQRQARRVFEERCSIYAPRLGVQWRRLALSSAQTRWGSASADGSIRLNWRLIHFALPTIDYVVAHELAHLREMNHSPRFWDVVRSVIPDVETARGTLRSDLLPALD
jgi:hypothetical protein